MVWIRSLAMVWLLCVQTAAAWDFNFSAVTNDLNSLTNDLNNLTATFYNLEGDVNATSKAIVAFLAYVEAHWPQIEAHLASIANLPDSIKYAANVVSSALPVAQNCAIILGSCVVASTIIATMPKIIKYCRTHKNHQHLNELVGDDYHD